MIAYADGEVRQEFVVVFTGRVVGGQLRASDESIEVRFVPASEVNALPIHPSVRLRLAHWLNRRETPYIG